MEDKLKFIKDLLSIRSELEGYDKIHEEIKKAVAFKGTNLFVLIFAIIVASVGLNMNSPAVIIGAMLISPLMGPINGIGYSLATYNFTLLKVSIRNLSLAVFASLMASAVYFYLTPVNEAHSELLARISPTIYDVIIALFGGFAGILALSSKLKGNVIPGVAIATALMPPICTAGYGLGTFQFNFFFGALYLFAINAVFIALATMIVSQYLKFPIRSDIPAEKKKSLNRYISIIILITIVPSVYLGYKLVKKEEFSMNAKSFLKDVSIVDGNYLMKSHLDEDSFSIELMFAGYGITDKIEMQIKKIAAMHRLDSSKVSINQGFNTSELQENTQKFLSERDMLENKLNTTVYALKQAEMKIDSLSNISTFGEKILAEAKVLYPSIEMCVYSEGYVYGAPKDTTSTDTSMVKVPMVVLYSNGTLKKNEQAQVQNWLMQRLSRKDVKVIFQ